PDSSSPAATNDRRSSLQNGWFAVTPIDLSEPSVRRSSTFPAECSNVPVTSRRPEPSSGSTGGQGAIASTAASPATSPFVEPHNLHGVVPGVSLLRGALGLT